jgi:F-type H+-transporting ATPase subunit a
MGGIDITTDQWVFWQWEAWPVVKLNATILFTWLVMAILAVGSWLVTRRLSTGPKVPRFQNMLEVLVMGMRDQIREVSRQDPGPYLPFVGTLFLFIAMANLLAVVPGYQPPTGSLSTTAALATCVFVAVPLYGMASQGLLGYLKHYIQPTPLMLPFNLTGELSRTLALAVRLYGNMMSGTVIAAILIGFVPLFIPILMQLLGLLTGMIQAYIFAVLAMVYIASATKAIREAEQNQAAEADPVRQDGVDDTRKQKTDSHEGEEDG